MICTLQLLSAVLQTVCSHQRRRDCSSIVPSRCSLPVTAALRVACLLQMAPSFQELAQQQPALAMQFASECCIKGGMRFAEEGSVHSRKASKAVTGAASSSESSSRPSESDDDTQPVPSPTD